ncbi:hypothetical protein D104_10795 [Marinomonas profundimaris]|uniref:Uncharacterized protein n=1 Tax=Marinomonas profundimaris TaxID=1208321 RepID=W1RSF9_9GAMM|nr:hypothetical protein D104_10795 [Marinomonas profundimaris]
MKYFKKILRGVDEQIEIEAKGVTIFKEPDPLGLIIVIR